MQDKDVVIPLRRTISTVILFYLMLLHCESKVNRSNVMKSLVGCYVNTPEGTFSSGMKNFLLLETFDSTADLSETCFR